MDPTPNTAPKSPFRNPYFYSSIVIVAVVAYVGYVLLSRYESNRAFERRRAEEQTEQRREDDRRAIEQLRGSELAVRALYISPAIIHRGESAQLCYDVTNAKSVTLNPPAGAVWPSHSRCLDISPKKTTTYTLTIANASGKSTSQTVTLQVH